MQIDAAMLQYQNHKLAQQLDVQRAEINGLKGKFSHLKSKQASYDDNLMTVNRVWNQVILCRGCLGLEFGCSSI